MDVTNRKEVSEAVAAVAKWTSEETNKNSNKRVFHVIINNAGKGSSSLFDWYDRDAIHKNG
jgi:hypothetical protein